MKLFRVTTLQLVFAVSLLLGSGQSGRATTIDFETGAPSLFSNTTPLTNFYSSLGVTFSGVDGSGGSILSQSSGFGILARSGVDFLAFNTLLLPSSTGSTEKVSFNSPISNFSLFVGGRDAGGYTATAFNSSNVQIGSVAINVAAGVYGQLSLALSGISYVEFSGSSSAFVADDLSFSAAAVPGPTVGAGTSSFALAALFLGWLVRGRGQQMV
jgi:hypothetical protein